MSEQATRRVPSQEGHTAEDARLVAAAVAGDCRAFAALYRRHLDPVYARLGRLVGPVSERDDSVQQISSTSTRRCRVSAARPRSARFSTASSSMSPTSTSSGTDGGGGGRWRWTSVSSTHWSRRTHHPEARARQRQELAWAFERLDALAPKRRLAFALVVIEGQPLAEAAALLGASADAIKQRVIEARRQLAEARAAKDEP